MGICTFVILLGPVTSATCHTSSILKHRTVGPGKFETSNKWAIFQWGYEAAMYAFEIIFFNS